MLNKFRISTSLFRNKQTISFLDVLERLAHRYPSPLKKMEALLPTPKKDNQDVINLCSDD